MSQRHALPSSWLAAAFAGVALLALLAGLAPSLTGAQALARRSLPSPIHHVVVIDLENHSFDNVLGFWCNTHLRRCPDGGMPASVTLSDGTVVIPKRDPDIVPQVSHSTVDQQKATNSGAMNGWQRIPGCQASTGYACISGYKPWQIPNLTRLAQDFAISDRTFSMQDSPSWHGHLYAVAASTDGFTGYNPALRNDPT